MIALTIKQERALARMNPVAAARRRKTMIQERDIVISTRMIRDLRREDPELAFDLYGPSLGDLANA